MPAADYYHGTFWSPAADLDEAEEAVFFSPQASYSDLDVVYVTNLEETALYFSS